MAGSTLLKFLTTLMTRSVTSPLSRPALAPMNLQAAGIAIAGAASCASRGRRGMRGSVPAWDFARMTGAEAVGGAGATAGWARARRHRDSTRDRERRCVERGPLGPIAAVLPRRDRPRERTAIVEPREDGPQEQNRAGRGGRRRTWDTGRDALATMA